MIIDEHVAVGHERGSTDLLVNSCVICDSSMITLRAPYHYFLLSPLMDSRLSEKILQSLKGHFRINKSSYVSRRCFILILP